MMTAAIPDNGLQL